MLKAVYYNKKFSRIAVLLIFLGAIFIMPACQGPKKYEETRSMMDTFIKVTVYSDADNAQKGINAAFTRMEEIVNAASIYDENAEAFRLNHEGYIDNPSQDLTNLVNLSIEYNKITDAYFDITVQPLLDLWSAGLWKETPDIQQNKVNETLELTGSDKIIVNGNRISFSTEGMKITLGGITKGYAIDEALKVISALGIKQAIIDAGGQIGTLGNKPDGKPWTVSLVNPDNTDENLATFNFKNEMSVSTSGNYERYFSPDKKVSHLLNPKTGFSVADFISVSVIAPTNTQADVLSTSIFVMGPEEGMKFAESLDNVECFMVDADRNIHTTSGINTYLVTN